MGQVFHDVEFRVVGRRLPGREHLGEPAGDWTSTIEGEFNRES